MESKLQSLMNNAMLNSENMNADHHWLSMLIDLPFRIIKFAITSSLNVLPTVDNLSLWKICRKMPDGSKLLSPVCLLCQSRLAKLCHILCICPSYQIPEINNRPKCRHDSILNNFVDLLVPFLDHYDVNCDLFNHTNHYVTFQSNVDSSTPCALQYPLYSVK
ncbi:hypothetical protein P9112_004006 [Eukaryota sp. TZLM1-RC]